MEGDLNLRKMEENLNSNGRRISGWLAYLALALPELGTAQPQLFLVFLGFSWFFLVFLGFLFGFSVFFFVFLGYSLLFFKS